MHSRRFFSFLNGDYKNISISKRCVADERYKALVIFRPGPSRRAFQGHVRALRRHGEQAGRDRPLQSHLLLLLPDLRPPGEMTLRSPTPPLPPPPSCPASFTSLHLISEPDPRRVVVFFSHLRSPPVSGSRGRSLRSATATRTPSGRC